MLIDWFTVGAQALNFLVLVWLLKRFLYKPVLNAIDTREKRIAAELADADAKKTEAQKEHDDFQSKNKAFDEQRAALLAKAADDAKTEGKRLLDEAQKEVASWRVRQADALRNDQTQLTSEISRLAQEQVFAIARKALADLATVSLEERMGEVFTRRLRETNGNAKQALAVALKTSSEIAVVRGTFALPAEQQAAIQNALNETFSADIKIRFETAANVVCGIELTTSGLKVAWSIADYLASLQKRLGALLKEEAEPTPEPQRKPSELPAPGTRPNSKEDNTLEQKADEHFA